MLEFAKIAWDKNKDKLKNYLSTTKQDEYDSYFLLLKCVVDNVLNPYLKDSGKCIHPYSAGINVSDITTIDNGDYQGTFLFIIPLDSYQPCIDEYYYTYVSYGSCSSCDTLLSISGYVTDILPTSEQVEDYMSLCLHLIQNMKQLYKED